MVLLIAVCAAFCIPCGIVSTNLVYGETSTATPSTDVINRSVLGSAVNVLTARAINELKMSDRVFDAEKLKELAVSEIVSSNSGASRSVVDVESYIGNIKNRLTYQNEFQTFWAYLTAELDYVKNQVDVCYENSNFYQVTLDYKRYTLAIDNYGQLDTFKDCYTQQFLDDLEKLSNDSMTYREFFQLYGTHIIGEAKFGGSINAWYFITYKDIPTDVDIKSGIQKEITEFNHGTNDKLLKYMKKTYGTTFSANDVKTAFYAKTIGGNQLFTTSIDDFENQYSSWVDSLNGNQAYYGLVGFGDGLVPLWELLPENYSNLSAEMQKAFEEYYKEAETEFWQRFGFLRQGN